MPRKTQTFSHKKSNSNPEKGPLSPTGDSWRAKDCAILNSKHMIDHGSKRGSFTEECNDLNDDIGQDDEN